MILNIVDSFPPYTLQALPFFIFGIVIPLIICYFSRTKFNRQHPTSKQIRVIVCTLFLSLIIPAVIVYLMQAEFLGEEFDGILLAISVGSLAIFIFTFILSVYFMALGIRNQNPILQEELEQDTER